MTCETVTLEGSVHAPPQAAPRGWCQIPPARVPSDLPTSFRMWVIPLRPEYKCLFFTAQDACS